MSSPPKGTSFPDCMPPLKSSGAIHGTNRLGSEAIVDIPVFGRIAGETAAAGK